MKDYSATITVTIGFQAANEEKAQEHAEDIADLLAAVPEKGKRLPAWYDSENIEKSVEDVTCESD